MNKLVEKKPPRAAAVLIGALSISACAMLIDPMLQTTEGKVAAATAKCNIPRAAIILHKDRTYDYNRAYLRSAEQENCLHWELMECDDGIRMYEPMGCIRQDKGY